MQSQPVSKECLTSLLEAQQRYFDLMHSCDLSQFDQVFMSSVQLHGFRDGKMLVWSAQAYKDVLLGRQSPQSQQASRTDELLLIDFASPSQAITKVRLKINTMRFVDHLIWHRLDGRWLVSSKGFHLEADDLPLR